MDLSGECSCRRQCSGGDGCAEGLIWRVFLCVSSTGGNGLVSIAAAVSQHRGDAGAEIASILRVVFVPGNWDLLLSLGTRVREVVRVLDWGQWRPLAGRVARSPA
jgi:hypothetical protein